MRLVPFVLLAACSPLQTEGDHLFVRNDGADMPVWVRGNTDSGDLIVWLAGGPGDAVALAYGPATDRLEESFGMVYWDQRGAGSAQGNAAPESFTIDQYIDDTEAVVDLVESVYEPDRIFLLGHSWGGMLGTAFLSDPDREARIAGWIDVGGNHDHPLVFPMKLAWLDAYAEARIDEGTDVEHWTEVHDFTSSNPPVSVEAFARWEEYTDGSNAVFHDPEAGFDIPFDLIFRSPDSLPAFLFVNLAHTGDNVYSDEVFTVLSYSERMAGITLPVALLWGRHDGIVPLPAAGAAYDSLGTPRSQKRLVTFEHSAHFPFLEEPAAFAEAVESFVDSVP